MLAAGFGKRFRSASTPKVLHHAAGEPLIGHVLRAAVGLDGLDRLVVVVGHGKEQVSEVVRARRPDAVFAEQPVPRGTGDAVAVAEEALAGFDGQVVVLSGDSPLITSRTLAALVDKHRNSGATVTLLTARMDDPTGYGRIIRSPDGIRIVEQADASPDEAAVREVSTGFWCFERQALFDALAKVTTDNVQGEYYLPDVVPLLAADGARVETLLGDRSEILGVNDRKQLAEAARILRARKLDELMASGVTIEDPAATYVDVGVEVGPFSSLRPGTRLKASSKAGSFVEMKSTTVGEGSKVPHLSYMGDAEIGDGVNIGAGSITCNYDGEAGVKSKTHIGNGVLLGSDTMLVAPVVVHENAITGAGSVVTKDVEPSTVVVGAPARPIRKRKAKLKGEAGSH